MDDRYAMINVFMPVFYLLITACSTRERAAPGLVNSGEGQVPELFQTRLISLKEKSSFFI
jgi:hypothetical protein